MYYVASEILSAGHPATCFYVLAFLGHPVMYCPLYDQLADLKADMFWFFCPRQTVIINHMKPRNVHNSIITTQALVRNMKSGLQEEPGGQDGHARLGKQALLHQGCSQLHTSKCRAKTTVSCKLHESYFCCRTIQKSSALCVPGARKPSHLSRDRWFKN